MHEPGWISFYEAAHVLREQGMGWAEACKLLRAACRDELLTTMVAPNDEPVGALPIEFWKRVAPSEWRQRDVDHDGPDADGCPLVVMLNEDDFNRWRSKAAEPAEPAKPRSSRKRDLARQAIEALWPDGVPQELINDRIEDAVVKRLKAKGLPEISRDTILRAAGRK
jgi:hypothetical protein